MQVSEWLKSLKPGDEVVAGDGYDFRTGRKLPNITTVSRITPKGFIRLADYRLCYPNGVIQGSGAWAIRPVTPQDLNALRKAELVWELDKRIDFDKFPLESLEAIYKVVQEEAVKNAQQ